MLLLKTLEFLNAAAKKFALESEGEITTIENAEISLFENIGTKLTGLGRRSCNYLSLLEVRGKNSPTRKSLEFIPHNSKRICARPSYLEPERKDKLRKNLFKIQAQTLEGPKPTFLKKIKKLLSLPYSKIAV